MLRKRQRGELNLLWVAVFSGVLALAAITALMSMRNEKNYFAEALNKVTGKMPDAVKEVAGPVVAEPKAGTLRKCVVDGKTVFSDTECKAGKAVVVQRTAGIESPKVAVAPSASATSDPVLDKAIEKQMK
ncbi:MAG: DUF4124 domain-containing protein [Pseudomonadota bacterium]